MTASWSASTSGVSPRASAGFTGESGGAVCLGARAGAGAGAAGRRGRVVRRYGCVADGGGARVAVAHDVDLEPAPARASSPDAGAAARAAANRALLDRRFYTAFKPPRKLFKKRKRAPANATLAT